MKNVLVIGGAGYIGSHVSKELLDNEYNVVVYDNLSSGFKSNILRDSTLVEADILDYDTLVETMKSKKIDAVIHLAALKAAGESMEAPEKYSVNNITGSVNILNACSECGIKAIVFSSSAATYGAPEYLPMDENHPTNPENYYGFTKLEIERFMKWYDELKGVRFAALRYFNAAGYDVTGECSGLEKGPANLLPVVMEAAAGMREKLMVFGDDYDTVDGTGVRDYIHVTDLARAHVMSLQYIEKENKSLTVNLGTGNGVSVLEMINTAKEITGRDIAYDIVGRRAGDPADLYASSQKAFDLLGWKAECSDVKTLLESTWNAYLANGVVKNT
ncbi:MAG: UDP-glucose 4-epimerase GalE [Fibrobacterales bacterium]